MCWKSQHVEDCKNFDMSEEEKVDFCGENFTNL